MWPGEPPGEDEQETLAGGAAIFRRAGTSSVAPTGELPAVGDDARADLMAGRQADCGAAKRIAALRARMVAWRAHSTMNAYLAGPFIDLICRKIDCGSSWRTQI